MKLLPLLTALTTLGVASIATATEPAHLTAGLQLVDEINATHSLGIFTDGEGTAINNYGGSWNSNNNPSFIRFFDEANGVLPANNTTCAPFVTHLLKHTYNWSWYAHTFLDPISNKAKRSASPNPWQYLALIEQNVGFASQITDALAAAPGDIISIHYSGTTSGHTVILVDLDTANPLPYPESGNNWNPLLAGTTFYRMRVLDSTSSPHSNDTRRFTVVDPDTDIATPHEIDGVGTGDMGLIVDAQGNIVGHTWSLPNSDYATQQSGWMGGINSRLELQADRTLVIGRLPAQP